MPGNEISDLFNSIPFITRYWFSGVILFSLVGKVGLVDPFRLILLWSEANHFIAILPDNTSVWISVFTFAIFFIFIFISIGKWYFVIVLFVLGMFLGRTGDYAFLVIFSWMVTLFLIEPMVITILYIWSQLNRDVIVQFWFGMQFKAMYFPWVLVIFNLIIRGDVTTEIVGILVGHVYYFFTFQYPQEYGGWAFLKTPSILYRFFPPQRGFVSGFGQPPEARRHAPQSSGRFPGRGVVLGSD